MQNTDKIEIQEAFRDYEPHPNIRKTVERLLNSIPKKYLYGLRMVVLRDSKELNHERRREKTISRKRKVKVNKCLGLYHEAWKGEQAYIELFVDRIQNPLGDNYKIDIPKYIRLIGNWFSKTNFFWDYRYGNTLFHEIGHHIHKTQKPEHAERENVADKWLRILREKYFYKKYWYLFPFVWALLSLDIWAKETAKKYKYKV